MAATWIKPLHVNKGKTITQTISDRTEYAENPEKTNDGDLVTGYECSPFMADFQFLAVKNQYEYKTGRENKDNSILAYHVRQSFKPGEIWQEEANRIGYETAMRFTGGEHQFIVATHVDKEHIHNHIIFNSTKFDGMGKFRNSKNSAFKLRKLSDKICAENGLSVIEKPGKDKDYSEWIGEKKALSNREKLRRIICTVLEKKPIDIQDFIRLMQAENYEIKEGKHLSFRSNGQKKYIRLNNLGKGSSKDMETVIFEIIAGKKSFAEPSKKINRLIDIEQKKQEGKGESYEQWAKIYNLKESANTLIYLQENKLTELDKLEESIEAATQIFDELTEQINQKDNRLNEISMLQRHIGNYRKAKDVYVEYKKSGYDKNFYAEHENILNLRQMAKQYFDELNVEKLPTIDNLKQEYATVLAEKKMLYVGYNQMKNNMRELVSAKSNINKILGEPQEKKVKKKYSHEL